VTEDDPPGSPDSGEVGELLEDLEELEETTESPDERRVLRRTTDVLDRVPGGRSFGVDDLAQQVVGGVTLSGPFVVTEEGWALAADMSPLRRVATVAIVGLISYGPLYAAARSGTPTARTRLPVSRFGFSL